jgi:Surface lipoprotein assembly modifier
MLIATMFRRASLLAVFVLGATVPAAIAGEAREKSDRTAAWTFEGSVGLKYDSNITVVEIDQLVPADDFAALIQLSVDYLNKFDAQNTLKVGYDFDQSLYFDFDEFNVQSHAASAKFRHKFGTEAGVPDVALSYRYAYSLLGGDAFLSMHRLSPTFGVYVSKPVYLLFEYTFADKDFIDRTDRDATVHSGGLDVYYFVDGSKFMVIAGYQYDDSDANDFDFDYAAHNGKIKIIKRFEAMGTTPKVSVGWEHEFRDYASPTSSDVANENREDQRDKFKAALEVPFAEMFNVALEYQYRNFTSNLDAADYAENLVEVRVGVEY